MTTEKEFEEIWAKYLKPLLISKSAEYGDSWKKNGLQGINNMLVSRADRLRNLITTKDGSNEMLLTSQLTDKERIFETNRDLANYAVLSLLFMTQNKLVDLKKAEKLSETKPLYKTEKRE